MCCAAECVKARADWQCRSEGFLQLVACPRCCINRFGRDDAMKLLVLFLIWCGLFLLSWPVALLALIVFPVIWLLCLPFRLMGMVVGAVFALLKTLLYLPARILGCRPNRTS